jgi:hypothetical protein
MECADMSALSDPGDMSPGSKAATCRRTPSSPLIPSPPATSSESCFRPPPIPGPDFAEEEGDDLLVQGLVLVAAEFWIGLVFDGLASAPRETFAWLAVNGCCPRGSFTPSSF